MKLLFLPAILVLSRQPFKPDLIVRRTLLSSLKRKNDNTEAPTLHQDRKQKLQLRNLDQLSADDENVPLLFTSIQAMMTAVQVFIWAESLYALMSTAIGVKYTGLFGEDDTLGVWLMKDEIRVMVVTSAFLVSYYAAHSNHSVKKLSLEELQQTHEELYLSHKADCSTDSCRESEERKKLIKKLYDHSMSYTDVEVPILWKSGRAFSFFGLSISGVTYFVKMVLNDSKETGGLMVTKMVSYCIIIFGNVFLVLANIKLLKKNLGSSLR